MLPWRDAPRNVHYRYEPIETVSVPAQTSLDIIGVEPKDLLLLLPVVALVAFVLGLMVGIVL